jgi:hypothetical protein
MGVTEQFPVLQSPAARVSSCGFRLLRTLLSIGGRIGIAVKYHQTAGAPRTGSPDFVNYVRVVG